MSDRKNDDDRPAVECPHCGEDGFHAKCLAAWARGIQRGIDDAVNDLRDPERAAIDPIPYLKRQAIGLDAMAAFLEAPDAGVRRRFASDHDATLERHGLTPSRADAPSNGERPEGG